MCLPEVSALWAMCQFQQEICKPEAIYAKIYYD